jgi:hypothetical protein
VENKDNEVEYPVDATDKIVDRIEEISNANLGILDAIKELRKSGKEKEKPVKPDKPGKSDPDDTKPDPPPIPPVGTLAPRAEITAPRPGEVVTGPTVHIFYRVTGDTSSVKSVVVSFDGIKRVVAGREGSAEFDAVRAGPHRAWVELADADDVIIPGTGASVDFEVSAPPVPSTPNNPPVPSKPPAGPVAKLRITAPAPGATVDGPMVHVTFSIDGDKAKVGHGHLSLDGKPDIKFDPITTIWMFDGVADGLHVLTGSLADLAHGTIVGSEARVEFNVRLPEPEPKPDGPPVIPTPVPDTGHDHGGPDPTPAPVPQGRPVKSFDFGPPGSPVAAGSVGVGLDLYTPARGYGWAGVEGLGVLDEGMPADPATRDLIYGRDGTFLVDLPNGTYTVTATIGHASFSHDDISIWAQGILVADGLKTAAGEFLRPSFSAAVTTGQLTLRIADRSDYRHDPNFVMCSIDVYFIDENPNPHHVGTIHDKIPNFGASPTVVGTGGPWSDPHTWSTGKVPAATDVVSIAPKATVTYDTVSDASLKAVVVREGGVLRFRPDINTRIKFQHFQVLDGGHLEIGTRLTPVKQDLMSDLIVADRPFDAADPDQYGNGLIVLGKITIHGAAVEPTFVRLAAEAMAGQDVLKLSAPVSGWRPGHTIVLPDTRHLRYDEKWWNYVPQWETATIKTVTADRMALTLATPLRFDHKGAWGYDHDGVIFSNGSYITVFDVKMYDESAYKLHFLPHVANLSRNVVIRSENPAGVRGHVLMTGRCEPDTQYCEARDMGRTTIDPIGPGNKIGVYPWHYHHAQGIPRPDGRWGDPPQFIAEGLSIWSSKPGRRERWGLVIHGSHGGLVRRCVVFGVAGAGYVGQDGTESHNVVEGNFGLGIVGESNPRWNDIQDGSVFWFNGFNNTIRDNVASGGVNVGQGIVTGSGFNLFGWAASKADTPVPLFPGADLAVAGQYKLIDIRSVPLLGFARNECYGATATGLTCWNLVSDSPSVVEDFRAWHVHEEGFFSYEIKNVTFDGFVVRGDPRSGTDAIGWTSGDYGSRDVTIRRADIQGMGYGVAGSMNTPGTFTIVDSYFRNYGENVSIPTQASPGSVGSPKSPRQTRIVNTKFAPLPGAPPLIAIALRASPAMPGADLTIKDEVFVTDYNRVSGDSFQVFYDEQHPDFVMPKSGTAIGLIGSPEAGLTNAQAWEKYGIAFAGAVAPRDAAKRPGIIGLIVPIKTTVPTKDKPGA